MERIGYHVEEKYFNGRAAQAIAFAQFRANEYNREVKVYLRDFNGSIREIETKQPEKKVA